MDSDQGSDLPAVSAADLTLREAAERARLSVKTLRRAIHKGEMPKRYAVGENGPQLVLAPPELDTWLDKRAAGVSNPSPLDKSLTTVQADEMSTVRALVEQLGRELTEERAARQRLAEEVAQLRALLAPSTAESQAAAVDEPAPEIQAPRRPPTRLERVRAALIRALSSQ